MNNEFLKISTVRQNVIALLDCQTGFQCPFDGGMNFRRTHIELYSQFVVGPFFFLPGQDFQQYNYVLWF